MSIESWFMSKIVPEPNSGCWLWNGSLNNRGYGQISKGGREGCMLAHRLLYRLHKGEDCGQCVLHRCDTPSCVNPDHLFLGSIADNNRDCLEKGRHIGNLTRGVERKSSSLTEDAVKHIRQKLMLQREYAVLYGITKSGVNAVQRRDTWRHIP